MPDTSSLKFNTAIPALDEYALDNNSPFLDNATKAPSSPVSTTNSVTPIKMISSCDTDILDGGAVLRFSEGSPNNVQYFVSLIPDDP